MTRPLFSGSLQDRAAIAGFLILLVAFIGLVLIPGYRLANQVAADSAALKLASEHRGEPESIASALTAIRDRLGSRVYIGRAVKDLGATLQGFDRALTELKGSAAGNSPELRELENLWSDYRKDLDPVAGFAGLPYSDSDSAGAQLNRQGRELLKDTRRAIQSGRGATAPLAAALSSVSSSLEKRVVTTSARLRTLMIAGIGFACLLVPFLAYFQWLKTRHERMAVEAQNQTRDILGTVKDGLFLIDADFRIGKAHSAALSTLFGRDDFSDMTLEELLREAVTEQTLATATKYVKLLWGERANENLIRSINPLAEVEVHFDRGDGGRDLRYLEFDFHRVKGEHGVRHILVTVNDVTSRVLLARELKESQSNAQGQMDMLLGLLQVDPTQLVSFLDDTVAALAHVNNILKVPARGDADFRAKIDQLFREMHRIKGEAATLGLASVESRAHSFEDLLKQLRDRPQLSGNDFLPLVVTSRRHPRPLAIDTWAGQPRRLAAGQRAADRHPDPNVRRRHRATWARATWALRWTRWHSASPRITARRSGSSPRGSTRCPPNCARRCVTSRSSSCATQWCTASRTLPHGAGATRTRPGCCS